MQISPDDLRAVNSDRHAAHSTRGSARGNSSDLLLGVAQVMTVLAVVASLYGVAVNALGLNLLAMAGFLWSAIMNAALFVVFGRVKR